MLWTSTFGVAMATARSDGIYSERHHFGSLRSPGEWDGMGPRGRFVDKYLENMCDQPIDSDQMALNLVGKFMTFRRFRHHVWHLLA